MLDEIKVRIIGMAVERHGASGYVWRTVSRLLIQTDAGATTDPDPGPQLIVSRRTSAVCLVPEAKTEFISS